MTDSAENRERVAAVKKTVAEIEELGGTVESEYKELRPQTWVEDLFDDPGGPDDPVGGGLFVRRVDFSGTNITDAALEHLKGLTNLTHLDLDGTKITDTGLKHLKELTKLEILHLSDTNVTDAGLEHLKGLTKLVFLDLGDTNVTDAGVKKLQQALPNCKIYH